MKYSMLVSMLFVALASGCDTTENVAPCDRNVVGNICTIAGSGQNGYDSNADTEALNALEARMSLPQDMVTAADGDLYIIDWNNHRIRSLGADGKLRWVAGRGELGGTLDDPANGDFNHPTNILFDPSGQNLIIAAWHNSKVRTLSIDTGLIVDTCGDGKRAYFGDEGPAKSCSLDLPASITFNAQGDLIIMDQANQVIREIDQAGNIHKIAGQCIIDAPEPSGPGPCAAGVMPLQCPAGPNGPSGKWTCGDPAVYCSSPCTPGYSGDDIPAAEMRMAQPFGQSATPAGRMIMDPKGNLYFADTANHLIRMIDTNGIVHRIAGQPPKNGEKQFGYSGDGGPALDALINYPVDVALGDDGTLFFSDVYNHCVRAIDPKGIISTVAGKCGEKGSGGDGGLATDAHLKLPYGIEWVDGRLNIADTGNHIIRTIKLR